MVLTDGQSRLCVVLLALALATLCNLAAADGRPRDNWRFKFKDFAIASWWGPGATEAEMKLYRECGFNVVMEGRYMQLDGYADADRGLAELDLAQRHGLGVMFDTYTMNDKPWGGVKGPFDQHPVHHPANLEELKWLYGKLGRHPALIGFMIGDDQGEVSERSAACTRFLHDQGATLMPWLCGWISPANLAQHNNPIVDPQIYPTLYEWQLPANELARRYAAAYAGFSRQCRDLGMVFWPMFNAAPPRDNEIVSDSLLRFPAYAALAYGAEGIWYFCYNGGSLQKQGAYRTEAEVKAALTPLWPVAKEINHRIARWGPLVLGRRSTGLFGTAFGAGKSAWPFAADLGPTQSAEALAAPAPGKLIRFMSRDLIAGVLTKPGERPLVMVVDCRASKRFGGLQPREVKLRFDPAVESLRVLEGADSRVVAGREVTLRLQAGEGQMLELGGDAAGALCADAAIYAATPAGMARQRDLSDGDLPGIRAAVLRLDAFGADPAPEYQAKYIELNGVRLAPVPASGGDGWVLRTVRLSRDELRLLRRRNEVTIRTECADAWKFRHLCLAVQLADGAWAKTNTDATVHSVAGWAFSEGQTWGQDGVAGPVVLAFP